MKSDEKYNEEKRSLIWIVDYDIYPEQGYYANMESIEVYKS